MCERSGGVAFEVLAEELELHMMCTDEEFADLADCFTNMVRSAASIPRFHAPGQHAFALKILLHICFCRRSYGFSSSIAVFPALFHAKSEQNSTASDLTCLLFVLLAVLRTSFPTHLARPSSLELPPPVGSS